MVMSKGLQAPRHKLKWKQTKMHLKWFFFRSRWLCILKDIFKRCICAVLARMCRNNNSIQQSEDIRFGERGDHTRVIVAFASKWWASGLLHSNANYLRTLTRGGMYGEIVCLCLLPSPDQWRAWLVCSRAPLMLRARPMSQYWAVLADVGNNGIQHVQTFYLAVSNKHP